MQGICEGEILKVEKRAKYGERNIVRYTVMAYIGGKKIVIPHVEAVNMFGGIADYTVVRQRAMFDTDETSDFPVEQNEIDATIGARIILAVLGPTNAIILGFKQHPNQVPEIIDADEKDPQGVFQFLGIRVEVSEEGDIQFIHKGLPSIAYKPGTSSLLDNNVLGEQLALAAESGGDVTGGNGSDAITPADKSEVVLWEMISGGGFKIRDSLGQGFVLAQADNLMTLTNNTIPSWLSPDAPQAANYSGYENEYLEFDKDAGSIEINTSKLTSIISNGDRTESTLGAYSHDVTKTYSVHIQDNEDRKIDGGLELAVEKKISVSVGDSYTIDGKKDLTLDFSGAKLTMKNGKVAIGGSAELLDLFDQTLQAMDKILTNIEALTVLGNLGLPSSPPVNIADFTLDQTTVAQIKTQLGTIKGSF